MPTENATKQNLQVCFTRCIRHRYLSLFWVMDGVRGLLNVSQFPHTIAHGLIGEPDLQASPPSLLITRNMFDRQAPPAPARRLWRLIAHRAHT